MYPDKTVTSLKCNALVSYPVRVVRLNFKERRKKCPIDHGSNLSRFTVFGIAQVVVKNGGLELDGSVSLLRLIS